MKTITEIIKIIESGIAYVQQNEQIINDLNVFPVPDGDTGSNMLSTMLSGYNEIITNKEKIDFIENVFEYFSKGCLYGARGNSGVITSQIFKGLFEGIKNNPLSEVNFSNIKNILESMKKYAYNSVPNPVEGTILSIIKEVANNFSNNSNDSLSILKEVVELANIALKNTPNQLKILKEANVVDSGGKGLVTFFEGIKFYFEGNPLTLKNSSETKEHKFIKADAHKNIGYCTEFILTLKDDLNFDKENFTKQVSKFGDSIVLIKEDDILKLHIHVKNPGQLLDFSQKYGEFSKIKIDNMTTQVEENHFIENASDRLEETIEEKEDFKLGIISVASGEGIEELMLENGANLIINGGQTMNPSVNDFVSAINSLNNKEIVILPNNSNIIMSAEQSINLISGKTIYVIPTKSIQQGIAVLYNLSNEFIPFKDYHDQVLKISQDLKYGEITKAVRDTNMNGINVIKDDYISISDKKILNANKNLFESAISLIKYIVNEEKEMLTIFHNSDVDEKTIDQIAKYVEDNYSYIDLEIKNGHQKLYYFLMFTE